MFFKVKRSPLPLHSLPSLFLSALEKFRRLRLTGQIDSPAPSGKRCLYGQKRAAGCVKLVSSRTTGYWLTIGYAISQHFQINAALNMWHLTTNGWVEHVAQEVEWAKWKVAGLIPGAS